MDERVNFILVGEPKEPIYQPCQIEVEKFKRRKPPLLLSYEIKPTFYKFKKRTADRLATATFPCCLIIQSLFTAILFSQINLKSILWWLFAIPIVTLLVKFIYKTIAQVINERRVKIHDNDILDHIYAAEYEGPPGSGKTSSIGTDGVKMARYMWAQVCEKYAMLEPFLDEIPFWPRKEKEDALEIIESYNFFKNSGTVPCLYTSFPAYVDGVPTNILTADHILQKEKLPYGSVLVMDETSLMFPQELYKVKPYELVEFFKFLRHFGNFHVFSAEQDEDSNVIYLRRVAGLHRTFIIQEWIHQPKFLIWLYNKLFNWCSKKPFTKKTVNFFLIFKQFYKAFGYRKYYFLDNNLSGVKTYVTRPNLKLDYDDRCYRNLYRCRNKSLKVTPWTSYIPDNFDLKRIFPEGLREISKSKAQIKQEAINKRRKNNGKKTTKSNTT